MLNATTSNVAMWSICSADIRSGISQCCNTINVLEWFNYSRIKHCINWINCQFDIIHFLVLWSITYRIDILLDGTRCIFFKIVKDLVNRNATLPHSITLLMRSFQDAFNLFNNFSINRKPISKLTVCPIFKSLKIWEK